MLQNAYLLAEIVADTAENEWNFAESLPEMRPGRRGRPPRARRRGAAAPGETARREAREGETWAVSLRHLRLCIHIGICKSRAKVL